MSLANYQSKNIPIRFGRIVPQDELVRGELAMKKIEELAIQNIEQVDKGDLTCNFINT